MSTKLDKETLIKQRFWFLLPFVALYDQVVFTLPAYTFPGLALDRVTYFTPVIDPLTVKNAPVSRGFAGRNLTIHNSPHERAVCRRSRRFEQASRYQNGELGRLCRPRIRSFRGGESSHSSVP